MFGIPLYEFVQQSIRSYYAAEFSQKDFYLPFQVVDLENQTYGDSLDQKAIQKAQEAALYAEQYSNHFETTLSSLEYNEAIIAYDLAIQKYRLAIKLLVEKQENISSYERELHKCEQRKNLLKIKFLATTLLPEDQIKLLSDLFLKIIDDDICLKLQELVRTTEDVNREPYHHFALACSFELQNRIEEACERYEILFHSLKRRPLQALAVLSRALDLCYHGNLSEIEDRLRLKADAIRCHFEELLIHLGKKNTINPTCFICYAWEDHIKDWLSNNLVKDLKLAGIQPIFDLFELGPGSNLPHYQQEKIKKADQIIIVGTPTFKKKCERENWKGLALEVQSIASRFEDKDPKEFVFTILKEGDRLEWYPDILAALQNLIASDFRLPQNYYQAALCLIGRQKKISMEIIQQYCIDFYNFVDCVVMKKVDLENHIEWRKRNIEGHEANSLNNNSKKSLSNVPKATENFIGREKDLVELERLLQENGRVTIRGLGGIGKTQLAYKYVEIHKDIYDFIFVIDARNITDLNNSLDELACVLSINKSKRSQRMKELKKEMANSSKMLLIINNVDEPKIAELLPTLIPLNNGHIIATSRLDVTAGYLNAKEKQLGALSESDAVKYLLLATKQQNEELARQIATRFSNFPLALSHVAAYINQKAISLEKYCSYLSNIAVLNRPVDKFDNYKETVKETWEISLKDIKKSNAIAIELIQFMSTLAPDKIPSFLFQDYLKQTHENLIDFDCDEATRILNKYSLLNQFSDFYSIHPLLSEIIREDVSSKVYINSLRVLNSTFSKYDSKDPRTWVKVYQLLTHYRCLLNHLSTQENEEIATSLHRLGVVLHDLGRYEEALKNLQQSFVIGKKLFNLEHPTIADSYASLGRVFDTLGRYNEALVHHQEGLGLYKKLYNDLHPKVSQSLTEIGLVLTKQGRYEESIDTHKQALELNIKYFGDKHVEVANSLNNIGKVFNTLGRYEQALESHRKAFDIHQKISDIDHPGLANSLNNLGLVQMNLGQFEKALENHNKALHIYENIYQGEHPGLACSYNNLGVVLRALGHYEAASENHIRALELRKKVYGDEHPDVATSLNHLGSVLKDLGQYDDALRYHHQAFQLRKKIFGEEHPDVGMSLNSLGLALQGKGHNLQALEYFQEALSLFKKLYSNDKHPDIAKTLNNVGLVLRKLGRYEESLKFHEEALELYSKLFGKEHPEVAYSVSRIGLVYRNIGRLEEALENHREVLRIRRRVYGEEHPDIASSYNNLAFALKDLGRHQEAYENFQIAFELRRKIFSNHAHPDIATSLNSLGLILRDLGFYQDALEHFKKALEEYDQLLCHEHEKACTLNNLGLILRNLCCYEESLEKHQTAFKIYRSLYGDDHPEIAFSLGRLGLVSRNLGFYYESLDYHQQALSQHLKIYGKKHTDVASSYNNLGFILRDLGHYPGSLHNHQQAFELRKELFGDEHPDIAISLNSLGLIHQDIGQYQQALDYFQKAFEQNVKLHRDDHADQATTLNNKGLILRILGKLTESKQCHSQALELRRKIYGKMGETHCEIASSLNDLGLVLRDLGCYDESLENIQKAYEIRKKIFKKEHIEIIRSLNSLGLILQDFGLHHKALEYFQEALALCNTLFTSSNLNTALTINHIGSALYILGRYEESLEHHLSAYQHFEKLFDGNHPDSAISLYHIGVVLNALGKHREALEKQELAAKKIKLFFDDDHPLVNKVVNNLSLIKTYLKLSSS